MSEKQKQQEKQAEKQEAIPVDVAVTTDETLIVSPENSALGLTVAKPNSSEEPTSESSPSVTPKPSPAGATFAPVIPLPTSIASNQSLLTRHNLVAPTLQSKTKPDFVLNVPKIYPGTRLSIIQFILAIVGMVLVPLSSWLPWYISATVNYRVGDLCVLGYELCTVVYLLIGIWAIGYWTVCVFKLASALTYSSPARRRYGRALAVGMSIMFNPIVLSCPILAVDLLAELLLNFGTMPPIGRLTIWVTLMAALTVPCFTAPWFYRFMLKLTAPANLVQNESSFESKLPAFVIAACHFVPMLVFVVYLLLMHITVKDFSYSGYFFYVFFGIAPICQALAFAMLSKIAKRMQAGT